MRLKINIKKLDVEFMFILLRVLLIVVLFPLLVAKAPNLATIIFVTVALFSFVETYITKQRQYSQLRTLLDVFADKILIDGSFIIFAFQGLVPWWAALIFLARDAITIAVGLILFNRNQRTVFRPGLLSRVMVFAQFIAMLSII